MPTLTLIAAVSRNGVIGRGNALPWRLPDDLRRFKALTMGRTVIMGRRTWESLGKPLPGRRNVVLSRTPGFRADGGEVFASLDAAWRTVPAGEEACVIGGAAVYAEALPRADRLHLTEVLADVEGDARFPDFDRAAWRETASEFHPADERHAWAFRFVDLVRRAP